MAWATRGSLVRLTVRYVNDETVVAIGLNDVIINVADIDIKNSGWHHDFFV